jgi:hypothetical protein
MVNRTTAKREQRTILSSSLRVCCKCYKVQDGSFDHWFNFLGFVAPSNEGKPHLDCQVTRLSMHIGNKSREQSTDRLDDDKQSQQGGIP